MFGFLVGGASLAGLLYMLRSHHCSGGYGYYRGDRDGCGGGRHGCGAARHGCGHSWGHGPHRGHHGPPWAGGFRAKRRFFLRRLFEELDTTPGQEKAIGRAIDRVAEAGRTLRSELGDSLGDLAEALRADELDDATLATLAADHDAALARFRSTATDALKEIHDALDEGQRAQVADFIQSRRRRWGGPYRTAPGDDA